MNNVASSREVSDITLKYWEQIKRIVDNRTRDINSGITAFHKGIEVSSFYKMLMDAEDNEDNKLYYARVARGMIGTILDVKALTDYQSRILTNRYIKLNSILNKLRGLDVEEEESDSEKKSMSIDDVAERVLNR